ncbi:NUDIX domain-containing protein [Nonomuraea phyllanthi]|uniref:NUDIX domain-containing protein n=1 Tax=Nonomuraea phyllanthi TaxID=2219224 RepID=A0A5C4VVS3_9ACTN|nr:CoA pyrophosphatase [Nonomuraea phyllanthi]KAB8190354.1 NUDIX domain-containing protein [Nonomuraea phyllanthi]
MTEVPHWLDRLVAQAQRIRVPRHLLPPDGSGRAAAVLMLFGEGPFGPDILLIQRSTRGRRHAGQPAFPGGGVDPDDGGVVAAALREAEEETGVDPSGVQVLGTMPELYLTYSDNRVTPVIAWWRRPSAVHAASPHEVDSVERVPVAELVDPGNRVMLRHPSGMAGPAFRVRGMLVWGFTAMILDTVLREGGLERPWDATRIEDLPQSVIDLASRG